MLSRFPSGFTLVELIAVILLLSVSMLGVSSAITWGALVFVDGTDRQRLLEQSRFVVERFTRELRNAVPYSTRVNNAGSCVEFIPILASGSYYDLPVTPNTGDTVQVIHDENFTQYVNSIDLVLGATNSSDIYNPVNTTRVNTSGYTIDAGTSIRTATITLSNANTDYNEEFAPSSNKPNRYYLVNQAVSYCIDFSQNTLRRYQYAIQTSQPDLSGAAGGDLMAEGVINVTGQAPSVFSFSDIERTTLQLYWQFAADNNEPMTFYHQVRVKNVS